MENTQMRIVERETYSVLTEWSTTKMIVFNCFQVVWCLLSPLIACFNSTLFILLFVFRRRLYRLRWLFPVDAKKSIDHLFLLERTKHQGQSCQSDCCLEKRRLILLVFNTTAMSHSHTSRSRVASYLSLCCSHAGMPMVVFVGVVQTLLGIWLFVTGSPLTLFRYVAILYAINAAASFVMIVINQSLGKRGKKAQETELREMIHKQFELKEVTTVDVVFYFTDTPSFVEFGDRDSVFSSLADPVCFSDVHIVVFQHADTMTSPLQFTLLDHSHLFRTSHRLNTVLLDCVDMTTDSSVSRTTFDSTSYAASLCSFTRTFETSVMFTNFNSLFASRTPADSHPFFRFLNKFIDYVDAIRLDLQ